MTCIIRIPCVVPEQDSLSEEVVQGTRGPGETLKPESGEAAVEFTRSKSKKIKKEMGIGYLDIRWDRRVKS